MGPESHTCGAEELQPRLLGKGKPCLRVGKLAKTLPQENVSGPQAGPPCSPACLGVGSGATTFQLRESWEPPWNLEAVLVAIIPRPYRLKRGLSLYFPFTERAKEAGKRDVRTLRDSIPHFSGLRRTLKVTAMAAVPSPPHTHLSQESWKLPRPNVSLLPWRLTATHPPCSSQNRTLRPKHCRMEPRSPGPVRPSQLLLPQVRHGRWE